MEIKDSLVGISSKFGTDLRQGSSQRGLLWVIIAQGFVILPPEHMKWFVWASLMIVGALGFFKKDSVVLHPEVEKALTEKFQGIDEEEDSL